MLVILFLSDEKGITLLILEANFSLSFLKSYPKLKANSKRAHSVLFPI